MRNGSRKPAKRIFGEMEKEVLRPTEESTADGSDSDSDADLHPVFWTKVPKSEESKAMVNTLSNLIYEDKTPDQLAVDFKENGNEAYKRGRKYFDSAVKYYNESLEWSLKGDTTLEDNAKLRCAVYNNLSAINLAKQNYRTVIDLSNQALLLTDSLEDQSSSSIVFLKTKAMFRTAQAYKGLGKHSAAQKHVENGISTLNSNFSMSNNEYKLLDDSIKSTLAGQRNALLKLQKEIKVFLKEKAEKERKSLKEKKEKNALDKRLRENLLDRGIKIGPLIFDVSSYTSSPLPSFSLITIDKEGKFPQYILETISKIFNKNIAANLFQKIKSTGIDLLSWPVLILYPENGQTDFVQEWSEFGSFRQQFSMMFPSTHRTEQNGVPNLDWDERGHYCIENLEVFFEERIVKEFDLSTPLEKQRLSFERKMEDHKVDWSKKPRIKVDMNKTLLELLIDRRYVVPGIPVISVVSTASPFYETLR